MGSGGIDTPFGAVTPFSADPAAGPTKAVGTSRLVVLAPIYIKGNRYRWIEKREATHA